MRRAAVVLFVLLSPILAGAQDRAWVAEGTVGYAGFVDDATRNYWVTGGGVRVRVGERVSIGAEYRLGWEPHHRLTATTGFSW